MRTHRPPRTAAALTLTALTGALLVAATGAGLVAAAAQGDLDATFATAGQAFVDLSTGVADPAGVAVLPDGTVVSVSTVGPTRDPGSAADVVVERWRADGSPDPAFGAGGAVTIDIAGTRDVAAAVAVDAEGRLLVAGTTATRWYGDTAFVARLLPTGALDPAFGAAPGGVVVAGVGPAGVEAAHAVLALPDGRVVVGGESAGGSRVFRLLADGRLDGVFGDGGVAYPGGGSGDERVRGLAPQPDGAIVGVGPSGGGISVFRLLPDGDVDSTFGESGAARTNLGDDATAVAVRPDGTIAVAGRGAGSALVLRYTGDGVLDEAFAGGHVREGFGESGGEAHAIAVIGDRVLVGGRAGSDGVLLSYEPDGARTLGYGERGIAYPAVDAVVAVARTADGGLALAGPVGDRAATEVVDAAGASRAEFRGPVRGSADASADELTALAVGPGGDVVLAGSAATGPDWDFAAARLTADGAPDTAFGGGAVTVDIGGSDRAHAVAALPDRSTVLVGDTTSGATDIALVRLTPAGERDRAFGGDGVVTTSVTDGREGARGAAALPDGRVVVAGFVDLAMVVLRYLPDGTLDPTFGDRGSVFVTVYDGWTQATAVAVEPDGSVWVAGETSTTVPEDRPGVDRDAVVVRLRTDGSPDPAFGGDGTTVVDLADGDDRVTGIALDGTGAAYLATTTFRPGPPSGEAPPSPAEEPVAGVSRVRADGSLDPAFSGDGALFSDELEGVPPLPGTVGVAVASDGDVVLASRAGSAIQVLRLNRDGAPDGGHGDGGMTSTGLGAGRAEPRAVVARPDGSVLVGGSLRASGTTAFTVVGVTATGGPDGSFAGGAPRVLTVAGSADELRAVTALPDGSVVAAGESRVGPAGDVALVRTLADGALDQGFGDHGVVLVDVSGGHDGAHAIAVQPDGKIVVAGFAGDDALIARFEPSGVPDRFFGDGGRVTIDVDDGAEDRAAAVALHPDGAIVVAGSALFRGDAQRGPSLDAVVARVTTDGVLDASFGDGGVAIADIGGGAEEATAVAVLPDGAIVAAGRRDDRALLLRRAPDGAVDTAFGGGTGTVVLDAVASGLTGVTAAPDGTIATAAAVGGDVVVARVDSSGRPVGTAPGGDDPSGAAAITRVPLGGETRSGGVLVQPDGAIVVAATVVAGATPSTAAAPDAVLVRLRSDGVPDPRFGVDGVARTGGAADTAIGAGIVPDGSRAPGTTPDGALLLAGASRGDATIARLLGGPAGPVGAPADLAITIAADPPSVVVGEPLRLAVRVGDDGPGPADGVVVTATVDGGAIVLGTTASQGEPCAEEPPPGTPATAPPPSSPATSTPPPVAATASPAATGGTSAPTVTGAPTADVVTAGVPDTVALTCAIGSLVPGDGANLTITVEPTRPGAVTATVRVSSDQQDPDRTDDTASVSTVVGPAVAVAAVPEVRVNPGVVRLGRVVAVTGSRLQPGLAVTVGQRGDVAARTAVVGPDGSVTVRLVVFAETTPGSRDVEIRGPGGVVLATTRLLVTMDSGSPPDFVARG